MGRVGVLKGVRVWAEEAQGEGGGGVGERLKSMARMSLRVYGLCALRRRRGYRVYFCRYRGRSLEFE